MPPADRRRAEARGRWAETLAAVFLSLKGYRILARRARTPLGEIDLVAKRGGTLAFVEVKARSGREAGIWALTPHQARRLAHAARHWLAGQPRYSQHDCRFDIVVVSPYQMPLHLADVIRDDGGGG